MVRTVIFLVAPTRPCLAGGQKAHSCHFRRPFLVHFLGEQKMNNQSLDEQRKNKKTLWRAKTEEPCNAWRRARQSQIPFSGIAANHLVYPLRRYDNLGLLIYSAPALIPKFILCTTIHATSTRLSSFCTKLTHIAVRRAMPLNLFWKKSNIFWVSKNRETMQCMVTSSAKPNEQIIFGRTKKEQDNLWACRKTVAPKL
jgi:hypothetical protein